MILFCDSSAFAKLYVREAGTDAVIQQAASSDMIAVCRIAWVEMMSAFARRSREHPADAPALAQARSRFVADWPRCLAVEVTQALVELAGDYSDAFTLRAYDSVQLAAVQTVHLELPGEVRFACFDDRLSKAARVLGIPAA